MKKTNKWDVKMIDYIAFSNKAAVDELYKALKKIRKKYDCGDNMIAVYVEKDDTDRVLCEGSARVFPKSLAVFAEYGGKGNVCGVTLGYPAEKDGEDNG